MHKIFKFFSFLSAIGFLIALSWTYAYLPLQVRFITIGGSLLSIDKDYFFYLLLGIGVLNNLIFFLINAFLRSKISDREDESKVRPWINDFALLKVAIDLFFISVIVFVGMYNAMDSAQLSSVAYIVYLGLGAVISWFLYFIYSIFSRLKVS